MIWKNSGSDVVAHFWEWYRRRYASQHNPVADLALDKCEEALKKREWEEFGYWHTIYLRERPRSPSARH